MKAQRGPADTERIDVLEDKKLRFPTLWNNKGDEFKKKNEHILRVCHILGHKLSLKNFRRAHQSLFHNYNGIKLDVKNRMKFGKFTDTWS